MATIGIIETGAGNITSLVAAVSRIGHTVKRLPKADVSGIDQLILPGQGRFGPVMTTLNEKAWVAVLRAWHAQKKPLLGICVGLQILFEESEEDPGIKGLGLLRGKVKKLNSPKQPMMGWSDVLFTPPDDTRNGDAYFVNSYVVSESDAAIAFAEYGQRFVAVVEKEAITACQFHPEKSGAYGDYLLRRWLNRNECVA